MKRVKEFKSDGEEVRAEHKIPCAQHIATENISEGGNYGSRDQGCFCPVVAWQDIIYLCRCSAIVSHCTH